MKGQKSIQESAAGNLCGQPRVVNKVKVFEDDPRCFPALNIVKIYYVDARVFLNVSGN